MQDKAQRHGDAEKAQVETGPVFFDKEVTEKIIACAIEVHRQLGRDEAQLLTYLRLSNKRTGLIATGMPEEP